MLFFVKVLVSGFRTPFTLHQVPETLFLNGRIKEFVHLKKKKKEKTIKKITLNDGTVITNQKVILDQIRTFYARLFENKKNCHNDFDWNSINNQQNKLTPEEALNIEGPLTVTEIGDALKGMKHNKTPGIDGFPAEFYKMFWSKLKYFVL